MRMGSKLQGANPPWTRLRTPAKVSLTLRVLARRKDGYHGVHLVLVPVSLYDTLAFQSSPGNPLSLEVDSPESLGPLEDNLVWKAAKAFEREAHLSLNAKIRLIKRIPSGAGVGGGSGDAAGTLVALNRLYGNPLSHDALLAAAEQLGSDVPFFIDACPALCEGRGERLTPLTALPRVPLLVVKPGFGIGTADAYGALAVARAGRLMPDPPPVPDLTSVDAIASALHNDFEIVLFERYPELATIRQALLTAGAAGAVLSGSGSAVCGLFRDAAARNRALQHVSSTERRWFVLPCETLPGHDYEFFS
jgi:4-diphosphocytidyl-2-C-methyl-D-erythritol kinase